MQIIPCGCYFGLDLGDASRLGFVWHFWRSGSSYRDSQESGWLPHSWRISRPKSDRNQTAAHNRASTSHLLTAATGAREVNSFNRKADKVLGRTSARAQPRRIAGKPSEAVSSAPSNSSPPVWRTQQKWQPITPVEHCREYHQGRMISSSRSNCVALPGTPERKPAVKEQGELE